jgi:thioredoxin-dependent peroxiredoxin
MTIPAVGKLAPDFVLKDDRNETVRLSDLRGRPVVLYFYPEDDTPGCTTEACEIRDDYASYQEAGVEILGISPDTPESHTRFKKKFDLPFPLLADEGHRVADRYGTWALKKNFGREYMGVKRTTFLIGSDGKIMRVFENVHAKGHSQEILDAVREAKISG